MEFEMIKEAVKVQRKRGRTGVYGPIIEDWLKSDNKTLVFKPKTQEEKKQIYHAVHWYKMSRKMDFSIYQESGTYNIYLIRA